MRRSTGLAFALAAFLAPAGATHAQAPAPAPTLTRFANLHGNSVVFVAYGNLWVVDRSGGVARRLTADPGQDLAPRYSPDGQWIAFTASYQGNQDVYVIPATGGTARRLTFHSDIVPHAPTRWGPDNLVVAWTPDSKDIVFLSRRMAWHNWFPRAFTVPVAGGLATPMPLDRAGYMSFGPDGHSIAYDRIFRDFRTWKRYDGGLAQQLFTYDFNSRVLTQITDWHGTNTSPMWFGRRIYFLSDRDSHRRANIWRTDLDTHQTVQVTHFTDYDIDSPTLGDADTPNGGISFQQGGHLYVIDLPSETLHQVPVSVPDDGTRTGPRWVHAADAIRDVDTAQQVDYALSPNGKRALFSARGDLFTVPAEHGATRNLTRTSDADEDHPSWSPDGKLIAYTTDGSGNQQIAVRPSAGGPERLLTHFAGGFFYAPFWSPDGKTLAFSDGEHRLWITGLDGSAPKQVALDAISEIHDQAWSPDGKWLAYSISRSQVQHNIYLYDVAGGHATKVSSDLENDSDPIFSPNGKYLFFVSARHENPTLSETEFNVATIKQSGIYAATLARDTASPFAPRSDEGAFAPDKKDADGSWHPGAAKPIHLDLDGLMARAVPLPVPSMDIAALDARGERVFYQTTPPQMIEGPLPGEKPALHAYDMDHRHDDTIIEGLDGYALAADGAHVLVKQGNDYSIIETKPGGGDKNKLELGGMRTEIVPTQEWSEMFENAWRLERDLFFSEKTNGVDWHSVHDAYAKLLPLVGSREDLNYLIGQVQGELGNSHTYVGGGDDGNPTDRVPTMLLGTDFAFDAASGRYRFGHVYAGDNTRTEYRSPLTAPGVGVKEGDFLLAVNGRELKAPVDPYSLFVGVEAPVTLTVAASAAGPRRDVAVDPVTDELALREQSWIAHNRALVDKASGGRVAYIYLSDMEAKGMEQFVRQFYPQLDRQALIVDDRFNGGGNIDQILLERLRRVLVGMSTNRERTPMTIPQQLIDGPKICLINQYSASDGDIFPFYFRKYGLGPLVGMRTWGGVRGIRGLWKLLDGGYITVPEDALYGLDGQWVIENHGVDPDVVIENTPGELMDGHDRQLETAVKLLTDKLDRTPTVKPPPPPLLPAYPPADAPQK
nr:S41 family peptidase [uncultured Lichenicoccus sp.]